jgi:hypothetical protein
MYRTKKSKVKSAFKVISAIVRRHQRLHYAAGHFLYQRGIVCEWTQNADREYQKIEEALKMIADLTIIDCD